jgi:hypothetical protein
VWLKPSGFLFTGGIVDFVAAGEVRIYLRLRAEDRLLLQERASALSAATSIRSRTWRIRAGGLSDNQLLTQEQCAPTGFDVLPVGVLHISGVVGPHKRNRHRLCDITVLHHAACRSASQPLQAKSTVRGTACLPLA